MYRSNKAYHKNFEHDSPRIVDKKLVSAIDLTVKLKPR
jgi:hypothetical protein